MIASQALRVAIVCVLFVGLASRSAPAAGKPAPAPGTVEAAVAQLEAEANDAFRPEGKLDITVVRPHAAVAKLSTSTVRDVLRMMNTRLTGDPLKDTYIRYHLMYVVNKAQDEGAEHFTRDLIALAGLVPKDLKIEFKLWLRYEPPEVAQRYYQLVNSCIVSVGFPPFNRQVGAPDSFQYMDAAQKAKCTAAWAEAQTLVGKFKAINSRENYLYNWRQIYMNWIIREYRGELIYDLVAQDDPRALERIIDAIVAAAASDPVRATDFASFLNKAYFDGMLGKHNAGELKSVAKKLRAAALASEIAAHNAGMKTQGAKGGPTMSSGWVNGGGRWRQVPESLFTVVFGIENDRVPAPVEVAKRIRPADTTPPPAPRLKPVTPDTISLEMIDSAIARGVTGLEKLRPPDVDLNHVSYTALNLPANYELADFSLPGQGALATWAMLAAGEDSQSDWMQHRLNWVLCYDSPNTYDRAMRLEALTKIHTKKFDPWLKRDSMWLADTMTEQGNWEQINLGARSAGYGDNANGQYAILGLWAAAQAGIEIPTATWQRSDKYWREAQRPVGAPDAGGWSVASSGALKKGANLNAFANQVSASMSAGGILSLYLTEMYLYGPKRVEVGQAYSPELQQGIDWLDKNFSLDHLDGDSDFYYYAWTIQNVGQATGYRTFNKDDWFRDITARLLNTQQPTGTWIGPKGPHVSTSFALLFLARARAPLAICKVRFEPVQTSSTSAKAKAHGASWNNRPNDMYNFVTDVSHRLETPTSWQIVDLDQSVVELIESPLLYLATDKQFKLAPEQIQRLREYIDAGGMLVCVPEGKNLVSPMSSMKALAEELCPGVEAKRRTEKNHPFYTLGVKPTKAKAIPTISYETQVRPRVVIVEKDLGRELQGNKPEDREAFDLLESLYLFAAGNDSHRPRIVTNYLIQHAAAPKVRIAVARINGGGVFDPEPLALPQLKAMAADRHGIDLTVSAVAPEALDATVKVGFLSVSTSTTISDPQAAALKKWMEAGGTLWLDAVAGSPASIHALDDLMPRLGLDKATSSGDQPVRTGAGLPGGYDLSHLATRNFRNDNGDRPSLQVCLSGKRAMAYICRGDICSGLAGVNHWGISGYVPRTARQLVCNSLLVFIPPPPATQPTTKPTTHPTSGPSTNPTTGPTTNATTLPTTRPILPATTQPVTMPATRAALPPTTQPATQAAVPPAVAPRIESGKK